MRRTFYKNLFQRNSFIQKMLLSILGLICVPLLGIQLISLVQSSNEFQRVNSHQYMTMLQSLGDSFQNELESLSQAALRISLDDSLEVPVKETSRPYAIYEATHILNKYNSIHPLTSSMGVYYRGANKVLRSTIINDLEYFSYGFNRTGSEGAAQLQAFFQSVDSLACYGTQGKEGSLSEVLFIAEPVTIPTPRKNEAVIFFTIEKKTLENWCAVFIPSSSGFGILSAEGDVLFHYGAFTEELMAAEDFSSFLANDHAQTYAIGTEEAQVIYKYRDADTDYLFLTAIPEDSVAAAAEAYTRKATTMLLFTGLLVCILLAVTIYINYKPVVELLSRHVDTKQQLAGMSELDLIDSHFFALDERLNDQNRLLTTFVLGDMLSGRQVTKADIDRYFPGNVYRYFTVAISNVFLGNAQARVIAERLEQRANGLLVITSIPNQPEMVLLYGSQTEIDIPHLRSLLGPLMEESAGHPIKLYFGSVVTDPEQILRSYKEALASSCPEDAPGSRTDAAYLSELIQNLEREISKGAKAKALQTLNRLELLMRDAGTVSKRYLLFMAVNACVSGIQKNRPEISSQEVDRLISLIGAPNAFQILRQLPAQLRSESNASPPEDTEELCRKMIDYVDRNCIDSSICLTSVADYLHTSIYTVSRLFKEKTGLGFKEYITGKRLERACSLLEATSTTVTEIAAECGFESISYFGAVFKNVYGISPSKFREKQKHE